MKLQFLAVSACLLTLAACSKPASDTQPSEAPFVVTEGSVADCQSAFSKQCKITESTSADYAKDSLALKYSPVRSGSRTQDKAGSLLQMEDLKLVADGKVHSGESDGGVKYDYAVTCTSNAMEVRVGGTAGKHSFLLRLFAPTQPGGDYTLYRSVKTPQYSFMQKGTCRTL